MRTVLVAALALVITALAGCGGTRTIYRPAAAPAPTSSAPATTPGGYSAQCVKQYGPGFPYLVGNHCEASPAAPTAAAPSPVSTTASASGTCVMGYEMIGGGRASGYFQTGQAPPAAPGGNGFDTGLDPALAYQLTLTNDSQATAEVTAFAVVFYNSAGAEDGSDQPELSQTAFIVPGQSLTWTELADQTVNGYGSGGNDANIPSDATSCALVQWYHPAP